MAALFKKIFGMNLRAATVYLTTGAVLVASGLSALSQNLPEGHASDFTSSIYFEPPHETQVKMKLSGAEASPLPGGALDVRQMRIETFSEEGRLQMIVQAPQCTYMPFERTANSAGKLELTTGDGKLHVTGEGFLWRQGDSSLTISNHVHTVMTSENFLKFSAP